jgi:hypothetical protein
MSVSITATDVARDPGLSQRLVETNLSPIKYILAANPGSLGVYLAFIVFVSACTAADREPLMEFLELFDVLDGVPPAPTRTAH